MTITLRLFNVDDPSRQLDARTLGEGQITLGRDAGQDWALDDPKRMLSRAHLVVAVRGDGATVKDVSSNGVYFADRNERLPSNKAVPVEFGEMLRFGPFNLLIERATGAAASSAGRDRLSGGSSAFADPVFAPPARDRAPAPDPFASALPEDPFGFQLNPGKSSAHGGEPLVPPATEDVWGRRREHKVGDWDAPTPKAAGHENLIGSGRTWSQPPPAPPEEVGFGFDAPFTQPMLRQVEVSRDDLAIPSDWDESGLGGPPPAPRAAAPPPSDLWRDPAPEPPRPRVEAAPFAPEPPPTPAPIFAPEPPPRPAPPPEPVYAPPVQAVEPPTPIAPAPPRQPRPQGETDGGAALVDAFCRGAKLDASIFSHEDAEETMERLGVIYRHMILGLSDLLGERTSVKNEYRMVRTTVRADDNNPFKWAPPQKVAAQLLLKPEDGFLDGPDAVNNSYQDLKKHLLCLLAGLRASLASTLDALSPAQVEANLKGQSMVMKNKGATAWAEYVRLHADFRKQADDNPDSLINREFRAAYERQLVELDGLAAQHRARNR